MAPSARYTTLQKGVTRLRRTWLPREFDPTGTYTNRVHERAIVFRIFAHAEVEHYVEDRVRELALAHADNWNRKRTASRVILGILSYYSGSRVLLGGQSSSSMLHHLRDVDHYVQKGLNELNSQIRSNNGVKEKDLLALFSRVGLLSDDFDQVWLNQMNSWGTVRGDYVHTGPSMVVRRPDPANEVAQIRDILSGLKVLDEKLSAL